MSEEYQKAAEQALRQWKMHMEECEQADFEDINHDEADLYRYCEKIIFTRFPNTGWISVKDRLPDIPGCYLVYWPNGCSIDYPNICSPVDVLCWFYSGTWGAPVSEQYPVTHWQPLPEPPTE